MRKSISFFLVLMTLFTMCSCSKREQTTVQGFHFDTLINITIDEDNLSAAEDAFSVCRTLENTFSRTKKGSELYKLNNKELSTPSSDLQRVIGFAQEISEETGGAFDITVAPLSDLWNIKERTTPPSDDEIKEALKNVGYKNITLSPFSAGAAKIDLGGIAKGYAADLIRNELIKKGVDRAIIDLGGNVHLIGEYTVGIRNPFNPDELFAKFTLKDKSAVTSGAYQRNFEYEGTVYHHILDPRTGHCADSGISSVTVISESSMLADALSTAIYVLGEEGLDLCKNHPGTDALLITDNGEIITTDGFSKKYSLTLLTLFDKN